MLAIRMAACCSGSDLLTAVHIISIVRSVDAFAFGRGRLVIVVVDGFLEAFNSITKVTAQIAQFASTEDQQDDQQQNQPMARTTQSHHVRHLQKW
ncbi:predicted ATPase [Zymobacter palmae]|uniref:Predicted ATPase n=1 Tax=Zymobacter palmae TaxID=33074 RepID=A0A348HHD4_9GAMM|nr:predicted ATPase [Zymobacter palmae]